MRIGLIDTGDKTFGKMPHIGLASLSAVLRQAGHEVAILDLYFAETGEQQSFFAQDFGLVGITCTSFAFVTALQTARAIRQANPGQRIVVGGPHVSVSLGAVLDEPEFDFAIYAEGETPRLGLVEALEAPGGPTPERLAQVERLIWRRDGRTAVNPRGSRITDLDALPFPDWSVFDNDLYDLYPLSSSRGCPHDCIYCASRAVMGDNRWVSRSPESLLAELKHNVADWGKRRFVIIDDSFNIRPERIKAFCRLLLEENLGMALGRGGHPRGPDRPGDAPAHAPQRVRIRVCGHRVRVQRGARQHRQGGDHRADRGRHPQHPRRGHHGLRQVHDRQPRRHPGDRAPVHRLRPAHGHAHGPLLPGPAHAPDPALGLGARARPYPVPGLYQRARLHRRAGVRDSGLPQGGAQMLLSVVIPTRHRPDFLVPLMDSLAHQDPVDFAWEVLVLDNSDPGRRDTEEACDQMAPGFPVPLRRIPVPEPGLHAGRNLGAQQARGEILGYLDDDMVLSPGWLAGVRLLREGRTQAVMGRIRPLWEPGTDPDHLPEWAAVVWDGKCSGYWGLVDLGDEPCPAEPDWVTGGNSFISRQLVLELGGFNPDGLPADRLAWRGDGETGFYRTFAARGHTAMYDPAAEALHRMTPTKVSLDYMLDRAFRQGVSESFSRVRAARGIERPWYTLLNDAYLRGQLFHREQVRANPDILAWVLRDNYLDGVP